MKYTIKTIGHPALKKKAAPVAEINDEIRKLSLEMAAMMHLFNGVGLAAPQIGVDKRLIVIDLKIEKPLNRMSPGEALLIPLMPLALINPEIIHYGPDKVLFEEGCLSVPQLYAHVSRSTSVILRTELLNREKIEIECSGFLAIVLQHEIDHLDGILFVDKISPSEYKKIKDRLEELKADPVKERR